MQVDVLVIGASVDGLVAAARLAQSGRRVLVLERQNDPGGLMAGGPIGAGARHAGFWPRADTLSERVRDALQLDRHGLSTTELPIPVAMTPDRAVRLSAQGAEEVGDGDGWRRHHAFLDRIAPLARTWLSDPPPSIGADDAVIPLAKRALQLRRLGRADMFELLRVGPSCVDDFLSETLTDPLLRAGLMLPALHGTWMGPRSPQSTAMYLLRHVLRSAAVSGGPVALVRALVAACASAGVQIQCSADVQRVELQGGRVTGVTLADGTTVEAPVVVSTIGPRETLTGLIPPKMQRPAQTEAITKVRTRGTWGAVHLVIEGPLRFHATDDQPVHQAILASDPLAIERCFDDIKYRRPPRNPVLDVTIPTAVDPGLAPDGMTVVSATTLVGHDQDAGWDEGARKALMVQVLQSVAAHSDLTSERVRAVRVVSPADCETVWGHHGGHPMHGELALDQLWALRPTRSLAGHATGTPGLWLASTGTGPGLIGTGLAGLHTADAITSGS